MIARKHLQTVALINRDRVLRARVRLYFRLRPGTLGPLLRRAGLGQADLVLCLLRLGELRWAEILVGKPIVYGPSFRTVLSQTGKKNQRVDRSPRVVFVQPHNPRKTCTRAHDRFEHFRVGRTEQQLRVRGVTRKDIRKALKWGWIRMEEVRHV